MTMLDILKSRLPEGLTIVGQKELSSKYRIEFEYEGTKTTADLSKTCAPGYHERNVDATVVTAMTAIFMDKGDYTRAKEWMGKLGSVAGDRCGCPFCSTYNFRNVGYRFDAGRCPMIYFPGGFSVAPKEERFKFCPVCGKPLETEAEA